jgi:predicted metal-dependent hydrolase
MEWAGCSFKDRSVISFRYLQAYSTELQQQVQNISEGPGLGAWLQSRHPHAHGVRTDSALYAYVMAQKNEFLRQADPINKVIFDSKLHVIQHALGMHTTTSRIQGSKLKTKRDIKIAALFKETPIAFLQMIVVHELAHLKIRDHDKAFYKLCHHMAPDYAQSEFELRVYLTHLETGGEKIWMPA